MTKSLEGKSAIVTGGGRGIGKAIAVAFAEAGAAVTVLARSGSEVEAVAESIRAGGGAALALECDVTDWHTVEGVVGEASSRFGSLDIFVNNAGNSQAREPVGDDDPQTWADVLATNLVGAYHGCRAAIPHLKTSGGGAIINLGSGMGHQGRAGNSSYNCAKAGLWMLTRCLSLELWEAGIAVNEIIPGPVFTEMTAAIFEPAKPHPQIPSEWVKLPEEVGPLAVYLASQSRHGPTGQSFSLARRPL